MLGFELQERLRPLNAVLTVPLQSWITAERCKQRPSPAAHTAKLVGYRDPAYLIGYVYQDYNRQLNGVLDLIKINLPTLPFSEQLRALEVLRQCGLQQIVEKFADYAAKRIQ